MYQLTVSGHTWNSVTFPIYDGDTGRWYLTLSEGGDMYILDPAKSGVTVPEIYYPPYSAMTFYMAFSVTERIALKGSADPVVKEFWETFQLALTTGTPVNPLSDAVVGGLNYLVSEASLPILASADRIPQIQAGIPGGV